MTRTNISITTALLITLSISLAQGGIKTRSADADARETLSEIRETAAAVGTDADELWTMISTSHQSPEAQQDRLTAMREEINKMGREIEAVEAERASLPSWEQQAIDKILPLARETADNTQNAILFFNANRGHLWAPEYQDEAERARIDSERIAKTLGTYLKYEKTHQTEEQLRKDLGTSGN